MFIIYDVIYTHIYEYIYKIVRYINITYIYIYVYNIIVITYKVRHTTHTQGSSLNKTYFKYFLIALTFLILVRYDEMMIAFMETLLWWLNQT